MSLPQVSSLTVVVNRPGTPKQWEILMKTVIKRENEEFLVISIKHVTGLTGLANPLGTQKQWEITRENGQKTRKWRVFGHNSLTFIGT